MLNPLAADLDHILAHTEGVWDDIRGQRIFLTGGTGFFGCWLLESFLWANGRLGLQAGVTVLTRSAAAFHRKVPHLASHSAVNCHEGHITSFDFPPGEFSFVIHAASDAGAQAGQITGEELYEINVAGTKKVLEFASRAGCRRFLFTSSGAVYGIQPADLWSIPEEYCGAPDPTDVSSWYAHSKRAAEFLCASSAARHGFAALIARCFTFLGPHLPLDGHFAAGNFIRDALAGGPIGIAGDGTTCRSYMYSADLMIWLWRILFRGRNSFPYNVGSEDPVTIVDLAHVVANAVHPRPAMEVLAVGRPGVAGPRYVPSTKRAQSDLGLATTITLKEAVRRTVIWHQRRMPERIGE